MHPMLSPLSTLYPLCLSRRTAFYRPYTRLCFRFWFRSCFSIDAVLGMFEPTARRVRIEGVCHMPEGLAGLRTHRNTVEVLSRQSFQSSYSLLAFQSVSVYRKDRVYLFDASANSFNIFQVRVSCLKQVAYVTCYQLDLDLFSHYTFL